MGSWGMGADGLQEWMMEQRPGTEAQEGGISLEQRPGTEAQELLGHVRGRVVQQPV